MRKKLALTLLLIMAFTMSQSSAPSSTGDLKILTVNSISSTNYAAPSSIYTISEENGSCDKAHIFFLSLPAKCLTADGLKVAIPNQMKIVPNRDIK